MGARKLTKKQDLFVNEYLIAFNATRAAKAAGYSEKTAYSMGEENLRKPEIRLAIEAAVEERNSRVKVDAEYVVRKLKQVVEADLTDLIALGKEGASEDELKKLPKEMRVLITEISPVANHSLGTWRYKFKIMDKTKCTELLGKHVGAFTEKFQIDGEFKVTSFADMVERVNKTKL